MAVLIYIFKIQALTFWRGFVGGGRNRRPLLLLPAVILPFVSYTSSLKLFQSWAISGNVDHVVYENYLSVTFLGFFIFLSFGGIPIVLHQFSKAKDIQLLLSKPVSRGLFFQCKVLLTSFYNSPLFLFIALPIICAYLYSMQVSAIYYVSVFFAVFAFVQYPTFIATVSALFFLKIAGINRAKNIATVLVAVLFLAGWAGLQFVRLSTINPTSIDFNPQNILKLVQIDFWNFLPFQLLTRFLVSIVQGDFLEFILNGAILFLGAYILLVLGARLADAANKQDWITSGSKSFVKRTKRDSKRLSVFTSSIAILTLFKKDMLLVWRDSRQTMSILLLMVILVVFPFLVQSHDTGFGQIPPIGFFALFSSVVTANISSRSIPFEGLAFRWNLICPQPITNIYVAKLLTAVTLTIGPVLIGLFVMNWRFGLGWKLLATTILLMAGIVLNSASLGLLMGIKYANFKWENPKQVLRQPGPFYLIISTLALTTAGLAVFLPTFYFISSLLAILLFLILVGGVQLLIARLSIKRLLKLEWYF
jgi:hypothetical protein